MTVLARYIDLSMVSLDNGIGETQPEPNTITAVGRKAWVEYSLFDRVGYSKTVVLDIYENMAGIFLCVR